MSLVTRDLIRPAGPADLSALIALERQVPTAAHWSPTQYEAIFEPGAPSRLCLLADDGELKGFLVAQTASPEWELENMVVAPAARRAGLGTLLLRRLLERARQQRALAILLEVRASNSLARAFYESCGFALAGSRPDYYHHPQEDAVIYRCELA